jgi:acyl-lipid omega-6 desaturase (Delta-12 desaturase)
LRTHKELLIATKPFASENRRLSWWHVCSTAAVLGLLLVIVCTELPWALRLPCSIVLGLVIVRMFVIYHDHQHGAILRGSRLADVLMRAFGIMILSPSSGWKRSHDHHHTYNSKLPGPNVGAFPLMDVESYRNATPYQRFLYATERHPVAILLGYATVFFVGMCVLPFLANPRRHFDAAVAIVGHIGLLMWFGFDEMDDLCLAVLIPCSIASALGAFLFYAQHNFPGARIWCQPNWSHTAAALDSSSYIEMGPLFRWFTGNIGYHHVHHLNSRIPFYRLPEAMAALEELQSPVTISLRPRDVLACFRQNLWDLENESLVPWSALRETSRAGKQETPARRAA